jgi:hypothetical protein
MTKYTFSQGKVIAEDGVYVPVVRKDRRLSRSGVLIIIPLQDTEERDESSINIDKENLHATKA